jgi:hypothetical protein
MPPPCDTSRRTFHLNPFTFPHNHLRMPIIRKYHGCVRKQFLPIVR